MNIPFQLENQVLQSHITCSRFERGTCYSSHWSSAGQVHYWEGTYQDRNFQMIARSPCSYEEPVASLVKDHVYVVKRKIRNLCVENPWIFRWTVTSLSMISHQVGKGHLWHQAIESDIIRADWLLRFLPSCNESIKARGWSEVSIETYEGNWSKFSLFWFIFFCFSP